jgi:ubiquinone/menaquinone biosynthesis C-methylase UbiE
MKELINLSEIRRLYRNGANVVDHLKRTLGEQYNTEQIVETAYDLQAGSYVDYVSKHAAEEAEYQSQVAAYLREVLSPGDSIADVGTGEMTTLAPVAAASYAEVGAAYAIDISLSRLFVGRKFLREQVSAELARKIQPLAATLFRLPFASDSIDVLWTSHALEPNGGRELEAITELARVARKHLVLFEPSYERNTEQGKQRMARLGYIKNLEGVIASLPGLELERVVRMPRPDEDPNASYAHVIRKKQVGAAVEPAPCCPLSRGRLERRGGYLYSAHSLLAYPVIEEIPVLRIEKGICASILDRSE